MRLEAAPVRRYRWRAATWRVGLELLALAVLTELASRLLSFQRLKRILASGSRGPGIEDPGAEAWLQAQEPFIRAVLERFPWRLSCLKRSLLLLAFFRCHGLSAELRIGVNRNGSGLQAHAWLWRGGRPWLESLSAIEPFTAILP